MIAASSVGGIEVFCHTPGKVVVRGESSTPLQDDVIRRWDTYLQIPRRVRERLGSERRDVPTLRRWPIGDGSAPAAHTALKLPALRADPIDLW